MRRDTPRLVAGRAVAVMLSGLVAAGCTTGAAPERGTPSPRVEVSGLPSTFVTAADWSAAVRPGSTVEAADPGIVVLRSAGARHYVVSVLNPGNGVSRWVSVPIPVTEVAPRAVFTSDDGHPWVVVTSSTGATSTLWVFDAYASGRDVQPTQGRTFTGENGKPPVVSVTDRGVLVTAVADRQPVVYRPASGVAQVFATPGQVPIRSYGTGVLVALAGGFGLIAEQVGWLSKDHVPPGVAANATATVLAVDGAFVVAAWTGRDERTTLALHELLTGSVRATSRLAAREPQPFLVARDGAWAVYGSRVFDLSTGAETALPGGPYSFTRIQDAVAYGAGPASTPVAVDLLTGAALDNRTAVAVPSDFDGLGHGLFVVPAPGGGDDRLYAVPLKRWQP